MIHPKELSSFSVFNSNHFEEVFDIGYKAAKEAIQKMLSKNKISDSVMVQANK